MAAPKQREESLIGRHAGLDERGNLAPEVTSRAHRGLCQGMGGAAMAQIARDRIAATKCQIVRTWESFE